MYPIIYRDKKPLRCIADTAVVHTVEPARLLPISSLATFNLKYEQESASGSLQPAEVSEWHCSSVN